MDERRLLLSQKLKINKQKNQRINLINSLPLDMSNVIEKSDLITSPESDKILDKIHEKWNHELHSKDFIFKYKDFRNEFSWEEEVVQFVQGIVIEVKLAYLFFGIDDSPMFLVDGNWVIQHFDTLWNSINNEDVWIIGQNFNYGVIVSCYAGYLEHDPNPEEIHFAITRWNN
ncbi:hypothetical protein EV294_1163 [Paenibacillus sp. BK033]|uniref:hypothetical protein n=1 Tax=Paenibacillus sp. BK033 TaxID=2512133 RepID=UPI0010435FFB|nr:hypothetical protein [Paenibacillus sp. BK033]TCM87923.1 hypothetical protein EV294_1163 [Paenibacillus sp. BK033]